MGASCFCLQRQPLLSIVAPFARAQPGGANTKLRRPIGTMVQRWSYDELGKLGEASDEPRMNPEPRLKYWTSCGSRPHMPATADESDEHVCVVGSLLPVARNCVCVVDSPCASLPETSSIACKAFLVCHGTSMGIPAHLASLVFRAGATGPSFGFGKHRACFFTLKLAAEIVGYELCGLSNLTALLYVFWDH